MKRALLISESSVYTDEDGKLIVRGGGEAFFHNLAKSLLKLNVAADVFSIREFSDQKLEENIDGVNYKRFNVRSRTSLGLLRYLKEAVKISKKYDYVFLNQFTPHLILPWIGLSKKIAVVYDVYRDMGLKFWVGQYGLFVGLVGSIVEKLQLRFDKKYADKIMTLSRSVEQKILRYLGEEVTQKIIMNPSPVIPMSEECEASQKEDVMLFVGRFVDYKNPEHVLFCLSRAKELYPHLKAIFVVARFEKSVLNSFEKAKCNFGFCDRDVELRFNSSNEEVLKLLGKSRLLIHPSYVEGQGLVILEAMANKLPVVAYELGAYRGMLTNMENAILVKKGDKEGLSRACLSVLGGDFQYSLKSLHNSKFSEKHFLNKLKLICG